MTLHPHCPITAEDSAIFEALAARKLYEQGGRKAYHVADQNDARLMLDLGLAADDGRGLTTRGYVVQEYTAEDFEHVTLATGGADCDYCGAEAHEPPFGGCEEQHS